MGMPLLTEAGFDVDFVVVFSTFFVPLSVGGGFDTGFPAPKGPLSLMGALVDPAGAGLAAGLSAWVLGLDAPAGLLSPAGFGGNLP